MKEFRLVEILDLPNSLFSKEKKVSYNWLKCDSEKVNEWIKLAKARNEEIKDNYRIKDWYLEFREV